MQSDNPLALQIKKHFSFPAEELLLQYLVMHVWRHC